MPLHEDCRFQIRKSPHLLRQFFPWLCPSTPQGMHLAAAFEKSTLCRISNFLILLSSFPVAMSIPGLLGAIGLFADEELAGTCEDKFIAVGFDFATIIFFSHLLLRPLRHPFEQLIKLEFLVQQTELGWLMLNKCRRLFYPSRVKLPLVKNVCELMFGINVSNLNFRIKINPAKQPTQSNSVGSWHMSHCGTPAFY